MSHRATYLQIADLYNLNEACVAIRRAFDSTPFLVGSATERPDYRDVDVRLLLDEETFDSFFPDCPRDPAIEPPDNHYWALVCVSISEHLSRITGLPVDFQVQRRDVANEQYRKPRHPLGIVRGRAKSGVSA